YFGLLSAGLAIALKDPVTDLAAWMFIIWRKPFDVGDRIELGKSKGDVIDIRPFKFTILEIGNWVDADQ
ncbi:MAG TPA: mechanosensitive ion channel protein MscS, partial [Balneola sp.]|nr:mechanosensitive ion channel protein MscS [Balneola sp.]